MQKRKLLPVPAGCVPAHAANVAHYVGSPEHKDGPSFAGQPRPRADATICDRSFADRLADINSWLRTAILAGHTGDWTGAFPRYVWHRAGVSVFEARLVNEVSGSYKAYEIEPDEIPAGL